MKQSKKRWICSFVLFSLLAVGILTPGHAFAQGQLWPMPDRLDFLGNCWEPTQVQLPPFPPIKQTMKYISWRNCNVARKKPMCVDIGVPAPLILPDGTPSACGVFSIPFNMRTCGGQMLTVMSGSLNATYSRTWLEDSAPQVPGLETQVWRFLINGDLLLSPFLLGMFGGNGHVPQCHHDFGNQIYWFGYLDYRNQCEGDVWTVEWVLDHECDDYHHNPDSGRPAPAAGYHPDRSFNMVSPSSFTPTTNIPVSQGFVAAENVRTIIYNPVGPQICFRDEPLQDGFIQPTLEFCLCGNGGPQYAISDFFGFGICGTSFNNSQLATKSFIQKRVGFFTDPAGIPTKAVIMKMGDLTYNDGCTQETTEEYFEGVEILGGPPAFQFDEFGGIFPLPPDFDDDASSNDFDCSKIKAVPHVSCKLIAANIFPK